MTAGLKPESLDFALESLVDKHGPTQVLVALEAVFAEKALFVNSAESIGNPSPTMAKALGRISAACGKAARVAAANCDVLGW